MSNGHHTTFRLQEFLSGVIAGGFASFMTQPFDVIRSVQVINPTKSQIISKNSLISSFFESCKLIYIDQNRGLKNFYRGVGVSMFRQSLGFGTYSYALFMINKIFVYYQLIETIGKYSCQAINAGISKIIAILLTIPAIYLQTRLELITLQKKNIMQVAKDIMKENNARQLFHGVNTVLFREVSFSIVQQISYKYLQTQFQASNSNINGHNISLFTNFLPGFFSGLFGMIISHPFEVIRNRMMIQTQFLTKEQIYTSLANGLVQIFKFTGVKGFFFGIVPRLIKKPINTALTWTLYEYLMKMETSF